jgi:carbamoyltransferase
MPGADLGRGWTDEEIEAYLVTAKIAYERPRDVADAVAACLADNGIVAWFQGRSEYGPRALGYRSLMAHPGHPQNLERMNDVKGREQFRPVAPMVLAERAAEIFGRGPDPQPLHALRARRRAGVARAHPDRRARRRHRAHPDDRPDESPLVHRMLERSSSAPGCPSS